MISYIFGSYKIWNKYIEFGNYCYSRFVVALLYEWNRVRFGGEMRTKIRMKDSWSCAENLRIVMSLADHST